MRSWRHSAGRTRNIPALETLARPDAVAVVTGQQVGLFSGPSYTVYKALTAVKLAARLTSRGIPAVPIFWLATEDHDAAEVSHCWSFDAAQQPVLLHVEPGEPDDRPVGTIPLHDPPLAALRASLAKLPHGDEVATIAEAAYAPGRTMGEAFRDLLRRILPDSLLYLDPLDPAIRALAAPLLRKALANADDIRARLTERDRELASAGYHSQVHVDGRGTLLFLLRDGRRIPLRRRDDGFQAGDGTISQDELAERAAELSPNALLRPVMQDHLLPTVAYIGGPAEIAYFAQSQVLYRTLLGRMPVVLPRAGFTLFDARAAKLAKRYEIAFADYFEGLETLESRIATRLVPTDIEEALVRATESITGHIDELRYKLEAYDPTLAAALDKSRAKILHQLAQIERKSGREALRREGRAEADAAYLYNLVHPRKHPQERLYSILPFLARHGRDLIDRLYENVHLDCPDHVIFTAPEAIAILRKRRPSTKQ